MAKPTDAPNRMRDRASPTAYTTDVPYQIAGCEDRVIILSTSRGDVRISPAEAMRLAQQLQDAIREANILMAGPEWMKRQVRKAVKARGREGQ